MDHPASSRAAELEKLISELRHDLRGAISPAALVADRLGMSQDPAVQRSGRTISAVVERVLTILDATCKVVPPRGEANAGPLLGGAKQR
jgi:hypothetical protein